MDQKVPLGNLKDENWVSDLEKKKVSLMRVFVEREDPTSKEVDDLMLRRFLRARNLNIEKASAMFLKYLKWRRAAVPNRFISQSEIKNQLADRKVFVQGFDKKGRRIGVVHFAKHSPHNRDLEEFKRFVIYGLDKLCTSSPSGQEQYTVIGDVEGWKYSNFDFRGYIACLEIMQEYFPERLGKLFVIHVPYVFWTVWKIIYPFIDKNTRDKIVFVENKNLEATLLQDIEESQLPEMYGGKLPLVAIQDSSD